MGMDPISWVVIGATVASAGSSIAAGDAAKEEGRKNSLQLKESAALIDVQKGVEAAQYNRLSGQLMGESIAQIGAAGGSPTGSYAAKLLDLQKQINIDKALGQNALEREKRSTLAKAASEERMGKYAQKSSRYDAFSTMLKGVSGVARYEGFGLDTSQGATRAGRG